MDLSNLNPIDLPKYKLGNVTHSKFLYFLFENGALVYVGKSSYPPEHRILNHVKGNKKFDEYSTLQLESDVDLDGAEKYFIVKYNPKYNKIHRTNMKWKEGTKRVMIFNRPGETTNDPEVAAEYGMVELNKTETLRQHWIDKGLIKPDDSDS